MSIYEAWIDAKRREAEAVEERRRIEDQLVQELHIPESLDGTSNHEACGFTIKVVGRMNRTVDSEKLQEIAAENGLSDHLGNLFRWKPEINAAAWKASAATITGPLSAAITTKPGRPSFTISKKD